MYHMASVLSAQHQKRDGPRVAVDENSNEITAIRLAGILRGKTVVTPSEQDHS